MTKRKLLLIISSIHSLFLVVCVFWFATLPPFFSKEDEVSLFSQIDKFLFTENDKPSPDELVFINTAYSPQLIPIYDENGFQIGEEPITDRMELARLFRALKDSKHRAVLCDMLFIDSTSVDSVLRKEIEATPNLAVSSLSSADHLEPGIFNVTYGYAEYEGIDDLALKFRIAKNDSTKSVPLKLYEITEDKRYNYGGYFSKIDSEWVLNNFVMNFRIRNFDIYRGNFKPIHLSEFVDMNPYVQMDIVKDKIVVIGDFMDNDQHDIVLGNIAGPLLILNVYYSLVHGDNIVNWFYLVFLFLGFAFISYLVFYPGNYFEQKSTLVKSKIIKRSLNFFELPFFVLLLSFISFSIFNHAIDTIVIYLYLVSLDWVFNYLAEKEIYMIYNHK